MTTAELLGLLSAYPGVPSDWKQPDIAAFEAERPHVHRWLSHVHPALRARWGDLCEQTRIALAASAEIAADNEVWE